MLSDPRRRRPGARSPWLLAAAVIALATSAAGVPTLVRTITQDSAHPADDWQAFDAYPVELFDLDGDGHLEIIDNNDNNHLYVLDPLNGRLLADLVTTFPDGWGARTINGVEAEHVVAGTSSLIVTNSAAYVTRFDFVPAQSNATHFTFNKEWETRLSVYDDNPGADAKPVLADTDADGKFEVFAQVEDHGVFALNGTDGSVRWSHNVSGGNAEATVSDGDRDGHLEVYFFSDDGQLRVYQAEDGRSEWSYDATSKLAWPASIPRGGTVANLDLGGRREVIFCARDAHNATNFTQDHMGLFVVRNDDMDAWGNLVWFRQPSWAAPLCYTRPVVYDGNHAGKPEVYGMDWNTIGHFPGNWERTGPAHVFRYSWDGSELWHVTLDTWWSNKDLALADLDGDNKVDVMASGPNDQGHDGWWLIGENNGTKERFIDVSPYKSSRGPRLADLEGDGTLDFVMPVEGDSAPTTPGQGAFQVWNSHSNASKLVWSGAQDGYEQPAPFTGSFQPHNDSNPWYVKVKVSSFHAVVNATFSVGGGAWQNLSFLARGPGWTMWDHSTSQIPNGTQVRFQAKDDFGKLLTSGNFTWPP